MKYADEGTLSLGVLDKLAEGIKFRTRELEDSWLFGITIKMTVQYVNRQTKEWQDKKATDYIKARAKAYRIREYARWQTCVEGSMGK